MDTLQTLAVFHYRSLLNLVMPLGNLNVITGANGSGKSNLYRSLRLLAETVQGDVVSALAREGGLDSTFWAGPETISRRMKNGDVPIQGTVKRDVSRLKLGFAGQTYGYCIELGLPEEGGSAFSLDPQIKRECIWAGAWYRPASLLVDRKGPVAKVRDGRSWKVVAQHLDTFDSLFTQLADPMAAPEVFELREQIRGWRFYDHFRTDADAPARQPQLGTRTPVLHHDGRDLAAAIQTIREVGDRQGLDEAIADAFPGGRVSVEVQGDGRFNLLFYQQGLLRPLSCAELSDGTLRYLLWVAALMTPRPPSLMVLNEPETSLHPDLLPALSRLIMRAAEQTQVWVVSHAGRLINALNQSPLCHALELEKQLGETSISGMGMLDEPPWQWPGK